MPKRLIVNADDFGLSHGVNCGIIEAAERGIVTSASLMVRQTAAAEAAKYASGSDRISVGLHLDLGEWVNRGGEWVPLYSVVPISDAAAVEAEIVRQLAAFERLMGRPPTHIDSHQHVHREEPVRSIVLRQAAVLAVPVRDFNADIRYCGDFYGQDEHGATTPGALSVQGLTAILEGLTEGTTELGCHPGYDDGLETPYRSERAQEVKVLCDPEIRRWLEQNHIELCPFEQRHVCRR